MKIEIERKKTRKQKKEKLETLGRPADFSIEEYMNKRAHNKTKCNETRATQIFVC